MKMANMVKAKEMFEALPSQIDWIISMEAGFDYNRGAHAYDMCVRATFQTKDQLMWYRSETAYIEIMNFLEAHLLEYHSVDYEIDDDSCNIPYEPV